MRPSPGHATLPHDYIPPGARAMSQRCPPSRPHGDLEPGNPAPRADDAVAIRPRTGSAPPASREIGGASGPEPTRYGDWEHRGRCTDF